MVDVGGTISVLLLGVGRDDVRGDKASRGDRATLIFSMVTGGAGDFLMNLFAWRGVVEPVVLLEVDFVSLYPNCTELSSSNGLFVDAR